MSEDADQEDYAAELAEGALSPEVTRNRKYLFGAYERWCGIQGVEPLTPHEEVVLAYLVDVSRSWSSSYRKLVVTAINAGHLQHQLPPPAGFRTRQYLRALRRVHGSGRREPLHSLTASDVAAMALAVNDISQDEARDRARFALIRAAALGGVQWTRVAQVLGSLFDLHREAVTLTDDACQVSYAGRSLRINYDSDALGLEALRQVWASDAGDRPLTLTDAADRASYVTTWRRCRRNSQGVAGQPTSTELASWDAESWWWMQRLVPRSAARDLRDVAWLLVGFTQAARFDELHEATVVRPSAVDTFLLVAERHKTSPDGADPHYMQVLHLGECGALCPACALADHLDHQARQREDRGGVIPLFATNYAGRVAAMTAANGRYRLQELWRRGGGDPEATVATRSLRSGGSVTAADDGASLQEVADLLRHADTLVTRAYLRRRNPALVEVHLNYGD